VLGLVGVAAHPTLAGKRQDTHGIAAYEALVADYHRGDSSAVDRLEAWSTADVDAAIEATHGHEDPLHDWEPWRYKAAMMLHTDLALKRPSSIKAVVDQFHTAQDLFRKAPASLAPFGIAWNAAAASWLRRQQQFLEALHLLDSARHDLHDPPRLTYEAGLAAEQLGVAFENIASSAFLSKSRLPPGIPLDLALKTNGGIALRYLATARTDLERAARKMPDDPVVRLHLARVLLLTRHDKEALAAASAVEANERDDAAAYIGALLTGAVEERRGRINEAAAHYRHAIARFPQGQFAYVALSEAELSAGHADAAHAAIAAMLARDVSGPRGHKEPWWFFTWEAADGVTDVFQAVRQDAR
jgi:tetratricopeptide (TPR) repeat protein